MLGEPVRLYSGNDVGTRLEHMMHLQNLWSTAYAILTRPDLFHTELEAERAKALSIALDLLQHHLESEFNLVSYAKVINNLSEKGKDSKDDDLYLTDIS